MSMLSYLALKSSVGKILTAQTVFLIALQCRKIFLSRFFLILFVFFLNSIHLFLFHYYRFMKGKSNPFANLMKVMATPSSANTSPTPTPSGSGCSSPVKQMADIDEEDEIEDESDRKSEGPSQTSESSRYLL